MGIKLFSDIQNNPQSPNPDPCSFRIIEEVVIGDYIVARVFYYGCTTFDGHKLMLLKSNKIPTPLDPHLLGNGHPVIARFEPNEEGWALARLCARELMANSYYQGL